MDRYQRALDQFDADAFVRKVGGEKESRSTHSHEYLLRCACGSSRLRWNAKKHTWICWGCRRTGSTLDLIQLQLGIDEMAAMRFVVAGYQGGEGHHVHLAATAQPVGVTARKRSTRLPEIMWPQGVERLDYCHAHANAWIYLHNRGVDRDTANAWRLGYGRTGWLRDYLVFPVFMDEALVYWQGRACFEPTPGAKRGYRKTLNPKSIEGHATAGDVLLNYDRASVQEHVVICEGPFDAIKVGEHAVALLGKVATPQKIARLLRMRALRFTVYLDRGTEERAAAMKLAGELSAQADVYIAEPPQGYDPGALSREQNAAVIANAMRYRRSLPEQRLAH